MKSLSIEEIAKMNITLGGEIFGEEVNICVVNNVIMLNGMVIDVYKSNCRYVVSKDYAFYDEDDGGDEEDIFPCVLVGGYKLFILECEKC